MIKNVHKKSAWDGKYIPSFKIVCLIGSRQLEVSNPMSRTRKVNVCNAHERVPSYHIISSMQDEQVFGQGDKYINNPRIIKEVAIIDAFLHENFPQARVRQK